MPKPHFSKLQATRATIDNLKNETAALQTQVAELHDDRAALINVLSEMVWQHCIIEGDTIDTACLSANEHACEMLVQMGVIADGNGRIYKMLKTKE